MSESPSQPAPSLEFELLENALLVQIDEAQIPRDATLDAAFALIDRCYVYLGGPIEAEGATLLPLRIETRAEADEAQLEALAEEFARGLAAAALRTRVSNATQQIRDYYTTRALFGAGGVSTIDELLAELDDEELDEDPLEIDVPWARSEEPGDEG